MFESQNIPQELSNEAHEVHVCCWVCNILFQKWLQNVQMLGDVDYMGA